MKFYSFFVFLLFVVSCKQIDEALVDSVDETTEKTPVETEDITEFDFLPTSTSNAIYKHATYTLSYVEDYEQAEWVAYSLEPSDIKDTNFDRPFFEIDEAVVTGSAHWKNYKNSGYNKGHLCPAGDRRGSYKDYEETFLTSNISPQTYEFNSGVWNRLEQKVRYWAKKYDGIYVVTAGVLSENLETIGFENVAVPKYFYKVLLAKDKSRMIGFLVPHKDSDKPLYEFVVPVDTIEKMTGIDFFPNLEDELENKLESKGDYKGWSF
ncbi:MAG: DNA/RNA non-specific endonuclease [Flavobacteriaceae bacterium]|nr:DNA/RNA non-specific endonuclease [Flavobacteriaceae bacterium]